MEKLDKLVNTLKKMSKQIKMTIDITLALYSNFPMKRTMMRSGAINNPMHTQETRLEYLSTNGGKASNFET